MGVGKNETKKRRLKIKTFIRHRNWRAYWGKLGALEIYGFGLKGINNKRYK